MPNGEVSAEEFAATERFFEPLANVLHEFANDHGLALIKYYHDAPSWDFAFKHPCGGFAKVESYRAEGDALRISGIWWRDSFEECLRYLRSGEATELVAPFASLRENLEKALVGVLDWSDFAPSSASSNPSWARFSAEQFQAMQPSYPEVRR